MNYLIRRKTREDCAPVVHVAQWFGMKLIKE